MRRVEGHRARERSASGLRPASAFVAVGLALLAVTGRAAQIAFLAPGDQPDPLRASEAPWPRFEITDGGGRPLAFSVECFDLTVSPRAMWRSHTPEHMVARLAEALGEDLAEDDRAALLERVLPTDPDGGLAPRAPRLLRFDASGAERVRRWLERGVLPEAGEELASAEHGRPIEGFELVPLEPGLLTLRWRPALVLAETTRVAHLGPAAARHPDWWTRRILGDLAGLVDPALAEEFLEPRGLDAAGRRAALRDGIWDELLDCTFRVVRRRIDPVVAYGVHELLRAEAVSPFQMQLAPILDRRHPVRPADSAPIRERAADDAQTLDDRFAGPEVTPRGDAFAILGHWGVLGPEDALAQARAERDAEPAVLDWFGLADPVERRAWQLETEWRPWSGLELLAHQVLSAPEWSARLEEEHRAYERRLRHVSPDRRGRWRDRRVPNYFQSASDAADVPRVECTLDAELQAAVHGELLAVLGEHRAAVAEAIVLDVASGDVLAVDGVYGYPLSGFAPLRHVFTPGSTMKAIVMAIALGQGVVRRDELFATFVPGGLVLDGVRPITEAEGAPDADFVTAEVGLSRSVNAVLVQIGVRIPAAVLHDTLLRLGYGHATGIGLGPEGAGHVPPLRDGTWRRVWEHASVSFGHELGVTLWQHAGALATVARGGLFRPLRLVRAVEQGDARWELPLAPPEPVLDGDACRIVREMMATGAEEGTGRHVASRAQCPEFEYLGTKTGTTEKVESEVSLHVEWPRQLELSARGEPWTVAEYKALRGQRNNLGLRRTCYTSSMCAVGRLPGDPRELLVLLVVDEPRSKVKFGSDVAGPAAIAILRRAFGLDPRPADQRAAEELAAAPVRPPRAAFADDELPWATAPRKGRR